MNRRDDRGQTGTEAGLTGRELLLLAALMRGLSVPEAARVNGLARSTAYRLAAGPGFRAALAQTKRAVLEDLRDELAALYKSVLRELRSLAAPRTPADPFSRIWELGSILESERETRRALGEDAPEEAPDPIPFDVPEGDTEQLLAGLPSEEETRADLERTLAEMEEAVAGLLT